MSSIFNLTGLSLELRDEIHDLCYVEAMQSDTDHLDLFFRFRKPLTQHFLVSRQLNAEYARRASQHHHLALFEYVTADVEGLSARPFQVSDISTEVKTLDVYL